jgi:Ran GTPase-activating protein (RanGAP) involved in mRNA processing and transport
MCCVVLCCVQSREAPLKVLDIGNNSLSPAAAEPLARLLHGKSEKLVEFNMYMNEIGDAGMAKLAPAFKECK